jgi:putative ABC transport system ATP-binding protein
MTFRVQCEDLSAGWPGKVLIDDFSLSAAFDDLNYALPITGRTGRGKSTLLYALSGMARPVRGIVRWQFLEDPEPISWSTDDSSFNALNEVRRRRFGFLLQDASMIPCFSVEENLRHMLRLRGIINSIEERVEEAVRHMLIEGETPQDFLPKFPVKLSGGMRQRMALAAAIAHDPVVLFADEPTASLDDQSGLEVLRAIRRWLDEAKGKRAFVFVTHRVETLHEGIGARRNLALHWQQESSGARAAALWRDVERVPLTKAD